MQRRRLLQLGLASAAMLTLVGGGIALWRPGWVDGRLSADGRAIFDAVARAVLDGLLPSDAASHAAARTAQLDRLDATLRAFPPVTQTELSQLLALLSAAPGRLAIAGLATPWAEASTAEIARALESMRTARTAPPQQAYHALRDLTNAAWFAEPAHAAAIGYPGPRTL